MRSKACAIKTRFFIWKYSFCLNVSGEWNFNLLQIETIYNFYIRITLAIMYRFQSFNQLIRVKLKKTLAIYNSWRIFRYLRTTIFQTGNKKACHNSVIFVIFMFYIQFILLPIYKNFVNSLRTFVFVPTRKSGAAKFRARKELQWRWC